MTMYVKTNFKNQPFVIEIEFDMDTTQKLTLKAAIELQRKLAQSIEKVVNK